MTRAAVAVALVAAVAGCGGGGSGEQEPPPAPPPDPLAVVYIQHDDGTFDSFLTRIDPATARARGPRADVGEFHDTWSFSPDRKQVALGQGGQGLGVHVYDVEAMREVRGIRTGIAAEALAWLTPRRVVAALQRDGIVVVDPVSGEELRRRRLRRGEGVCFGGGGASAATRRGLVLLLGAPDRAAPRLLRVDAEGEVRAARLRRGGAWRCGRAGLAVDGGGDRAWVVSRAGVAEVDLATMTVAYRRLRGPVPSRSEPVVSRLDDRTLVAGPSVIDTSTWTRSVVDRRAQDATAAAGVVLAYDGWDVRRAPGRGLGLRAYTPDGRRRFHVLAGRQIVDVEVAGGRAYAIGVGTIYTVELKAGRVTSRLRAPGTELHLLE